MTLVGTPMEGIGHEIRQTEFSIAVFRGEYVSRKFPEH